MTSQPLETLPHIIYEAAGHLGVLTIKLAVSLSEGGEQELAGVPDRRQEVSLTLARERILHHTGAAGVITRTQTQVFTCQ